MTNFHDQDVPGRLSSLEYNTLETFEDCFVAINIHNDEALMNIFNFGLYFVIYQCWCCFFLSRSVWKPGRTFPGRPSICQKD